MRPTLPISDAMAGWQAAIATLPPRAPRRLGLLALQAGTTVALLALPLSLAVMNIGLVLAVVGALVARAPLYATPGFRWGVAFTGCCVVSEILGWAGDGVAPTRLNLLYSWVMLPLGLAAWSDARARHLALRALVIGLLAAAALALVQFTVGYDINRRPLRVALEGARFSPVSGFLGYNLTYGAVACLTGAALLGATRELGRGWRTTGRVAALAGVVLSIARLALIGAVAAVVVRLALATGRWRRAALPVAVGALVACGLLLQQLAPEKFAGLVHFEDGRRYIWSISAGMVGDHPLGLGGPKRFQAEYARRWPAAFGWRNDLVVREPHVNHAHNNALVIATQNGLPALVCHLGLLIAVGLAILRVARHDREAAAGAAAVLVAFIVAGLFNNLVGQGETAYATWLALALALTGARRGADFPSGPGAPP